jgi:hypothetical protein
MVIDHLFLHIFDELDSSDLQYVALVALLTLFLYGVALFLSKHCDIVAICDSSVADHGARASSFCSKCTSFLKKQKKNG